MTQPRAIHQTEHDLTFRAMGSDIRLLIGEPVEPGLPSAAFAARAARAFIERFDERLSRFRPHSELSVMNGDVRPEVPASDLLRQVVHAAVWSAERTGGLLDPTLVGALERIGYDRSHDGIASAPLTEALAAAPPRHPARPDSRSRWREIEVDDDAGLVRRPPGVRIDSGGVGKGLAADLVAAQLAGYSRFVVDCGGDLRIGGPDAARNPYKVEVEHPLTGARILALRLGEGGVATSGLNVRVWRREDGGFHHHLLDPATRQPAWTGLVGVTAAGRSALEAETLAKAALLSGPEGAREVLATSGGVLVHDDGRVEYAGPVEVGHPRLRVRVPGLDGVEPIELEVPAS